MNGWLKQGQRGFTLIELLAVMAILAVLSAMVAPAVSGTKEAGVDALTLQNATQVRTAATSFFKDQTKSEVRTPHSITTTAKLPGSNGIVPSADTPIVATGTQGVSSRWPEKFVTLGQSPDATVAAIGATYSSVFPTGASKVAEVVVLDDDGKTIKGSTFLAKFSAVDVTTLVSGGYLSAMPTGADIESDGIRNFLWLFEKHSSTGESDDDRAVAVFKLIKIDKLESQTETISGVAVQKVKLTYERIF